MLETVWPSLPAAFRDELTLQCVKQLRTSPDDCEAFARIVAELIKTHVINIGVIVSGNTMRNINNCQQDP